MDAKVIAKSLLWKTTKGRQVQELAKLIPSLKA